MFHVEQKETSPEYLFGRKVAEIRKELGLSQRKFAEKLSENGMSVDASAVSRLEGGDRALPLSEVYTIAEVLGVSAKNLVPQMSNPKAELETLRRSADNSWVIMGTNAAALVSKMEEIVDRLTEHPELMSDLVSKEKVTIKSPGEYFEWVVENTPGAFDRRFNEGGFSLDDIAWVDTPERKAYYLKMLVKLIDPFIAGQTHPDLREDAAWRQEPPEGHDG